MSYKSLTASRKPLIGVIRGYNKRGIHDRNCAKYRIPNSLVKAAPAVDFQIYCPRSTLSAHCGWFISHTGEFCRNIQGLKRIQLRAHLVLRRVPHPEVMFSSHAWARRDCLLSSSSSKTDRKKGVTVNSSFQITLIKCLFYMQKYCRRKHVKRDLYWHD